MFHLDSATIIGDEKNSKLLWEPLRGGNISFKIEESPKNVTDGKMFSGPSFTYHQMYTKDIVNE